MWTKKNGKSIANTSLWCLSMIFIGYSCFAMIVIRSNANTPLDENDPENAFDLMSYLAREQYGSAPFLTGQFFNTPYEQGNEVVEGKLFMVGNIAIVRNAAGPEGSGPEGD